MTTTSSDRKNSEPAMVSAGRQELMGGALLVVGCLVFAGLVVAGANVVSGVGLVLAVWGIALLASGIVQSRKNHDSGPAQETTPSRTGVLALVLAFIVPPVGLLIAAYRPSQERTPGLSAQSLAIPVGAILTVLYTFGIVLAAAFARSPN